MGLATNHRYLQFKVKLKRKPHPDAGEPLVLPWAAPSSFRYGKHALVSYTGLNMPLGHGNPRAELSIQLACSLQSLSRFLPSAC